ncbi:MAG: UDP-N-acetylmuramoyl-L-alanyl-D-glutamate--2,6-diaminopimelate ligase [Gemmatimonadota bacterium]|nr:UDP-N-acetylmuramoyl-L-alanyl-D-glutamate--2,6-diaminopimelate ligase [Gemmatimonadota bacterium]
MTEARAILEALREHGQLQAEPPAVPAITAVASDSRRVTPGALFCAIEGSAMDGHAFVADAARRGAAATLVARRLDDVSIPQILVRDSRVAAAAAAAAWFGYPARTLQLIGVTGTNGKSTTVALIRHVLNAAGDVGALGTLGAMDGVGGTLPDDAGLTTPGPVELQAALAALRARGVRTVVMEASSHALHQRRVHGLAFAGAVYTNLTHDHLDYHGDYDAYLAAKMLLSEQLAGAGSVEVVNADDPAWGALPTHPPARRIEFSALGAAEVHVRNLTCGPEGSSFILVCGEGRAAVVLPLVGDFNVSNALGAAAVAWGLGIPLELIAARLAAAPQVPGRLERLVREPFVVLRDYAHTPDALQRVLRAVRSMTAGRVLVLFGAGGDRDRRKRAVMGEVAAREADLAIVTSDNPRTEDPERILDDIEAGLGGVAHVRIADRREAIARALRLVQPGDTLVLAGKGHETYQVVGTTKLPFDEAVIVREALEVAR